ncbi:kinase-like protein [Thozetella sp. PMI_491]|nr:kinase-like protein [Thozetella sp. PMI_491]
MSDYHTEPPVTPDDDSTPGSPGMYTSSEASTPLGPPSSNSDHPPFGSASSSPSAASQGDLPRRVPSLRTVSEPQSISSMSASSSVTGTLSNARRPPPSATSLPLDIMAKARALQQQRSGRPPLSTQSTGAAASRGSPIGGAPSPIGGLNPTGALAGGLAGGVPANLRMPGGIPGGIAHLGRPLPHGFPRSSPAVPSVAGTGKGPSLSERRAMKLGGLPGGPPGTGRATPKLSDMNGGDQKAAINGEGRGSKLSDFKQYIDSEKGWITFEGAATITRTGVNFANGKTFSISLDEVEILDELGKGNYGTVYKVRHSRSRVPRFGQGLSQFKAPSRQSSNASEKDGSTADSSPLSPSNDSTTSGIVMAMKELRLELDEAKFTTILKELVILHECVSPYIIDFYGAFYQEGAVYMCIEYMDGGSIDKLYAGGIPEPILRKITYATIMGLKSLKDDHNIIHRDVKPTNILANTRGQVKICDFGVSGNLVASIAKTNIGCQSYMAPERISGGGMSTVGGAAIGTYSVQSDIWSLGLTIIECAMGQYPYPPEVSSTIFSQLSAIVEGDPPDLPSEGYSSTARDFVKSCLNKNPIKRHTYPMLLTHPWIKPLTQPETISEDAEGEDAAADGSLTDGVGALDLDGTPAGDKEVADWVRSVLDRKAKGEVLSPPEKERPALHAAPLDQLSPLASPTVDRFKISAAEAH